MVVVTSFSKKVYDQTGKKMLETFVEHWPCNIIAYYDEEEPDFKHEKIEYRPFYEIPGVVPFLQHLTTIPQANGVVLQNGKERYNYNYDIWKFCRKMFAQFDVLQKEKDKVFWLDADVVTKKDIPAKFLEDIFEGSHLVLLDRKGFHSETGFVGFDTTHPKFPTFLSMYIDTLRKGLIFQMKRWHDCEAFDFARMGEGRDLSPFWKKDDPLGVWDKTILKEYMDHFKGQRKYLVNEISESIPENAQDEGEVHGEVPEAPRRGNQQLH